MPLQLKAVQLPVWMKTSLELGALSAELDCKTFSATLTLPPGETSLERGMGILPNYSFDPQFTAGFDLDYGTGEWEISMGGTQDRSYRSREFKRPEMRWGRLYVNSTVTGVARGRVRETATGFPLILDGGGLHAQLSGRYDIVHLSVLDIFLAPGSTSAIMNIPGIRTLLRPFTAKVFGRIETEVDAWLTGRLQGEMNVEAEGDIRVGLGADIVDFDARFSPLTFRLTIGGDLEASYGYPAPSYRGLNFEAYAEGAAKLWPFDQVEERFIIFRIPSPSAARNARGTAGGMQLLPVRAAPRVRVREAEQADYETFLPGAEVHGSAAGRFARLARPSQARDGGGTRAQVDLPLLGNVYRDSSPALSPLTLKPNISRRPCGTAQAI